ncbi:hypothetical protein ACPOL_5269 [Acidisarcina polymorpha]|uniref:Uncharacterized protein n=1 Tax=Acidisarcina polymorpha TaxID=2211140 RepID=A0A2Z5G601_9BACT|nr:hypothetical protein ACPOL_5269 [Acidisarcina polymorpha]
MHDQDLIKADLQVDVQRSRAFLQRSPAFLRSESITGCRGSWQGIRIDTGIQGIDRESHEAA